MERMLHDANGASTIRSMRELWESTRLRAEVSRPAASSSAPKIGEPVRWLDVLQDILGVGYGRKHETRFASGTWVQSKRRAFPSAGALYPIDAVVSIAAHHPDGGNYLYSVDDGLIPYSSAPLAATDFARLALGDSPQPAIEAVIFLLARPWTSMAKYGLRGYIYCHLDAAHAASNLGMYARALGAETRTHLRFSRQVVTESLQLAGSCREPLIVLSLGKAESQIGSERDVSGYVVQEQRKSELRRSTVPAANRSDPLAVRLAPPSAEERLNWLRFTEICSCNAGYSFTATTATPVLVDEGSAPPSIALPEPARFPNSAAEIRAAIVRRRSAKGFEDACIHASQIATLLGNLTLELPVDCRQSTVDLKLTMMMRAVAGLEVGAYSFDPHERALRKRGATEKPYDFQAACMGQSLARTAAALILFHVPISSLFAKFGTAAFAESHFQAAHLAQQMYLTAAWIGLGITCIGGFDEVRLATLANLPAREEVIYVVALGVANDRVVKEDRLEVAFSHGFDSSRESSPS